MISPWWLTCSVQVVAGQHNIHLPDLHAQVRRVHAGFLHPNYTWRDKEFDIALVQLRSPLHFTDYVKVVPVPFTNNDSMNKREPVVKRTLVDKEG